MAKIASLIRKHRILFIVLVIASFLRLYKLGAVPVSLYVDEVDVGYQALSMLKTGKDYFGNPWPLHFQSFAEFRTPFNIYSVVPLISIFGLTPLAVRLPSAIFGILSVLLIYMLVREILLFGKQSIRRGNIDKIATVSAAILAFSPWHIQFSRVALEVSPLVFFLLLAVYLFFKGLKKPQLLWLSALSFAITPWIYSTAKFFTPFFMLFLIILFKKQLLRIPRKHMINSVLVVLLLGLPMLFVILTGKGGMRFNYISIFTDPTAPTEVNYAREFDSNVRGEEGIGRRPTFSDKIFHNKITFWEDKVVANYASAFSFDFLFIKGDPNPRHSPDDVGMFYLIESISLIIGIILFFSGYKDKRIKLYVLFWILLGIIPSSITRDGGYHAARFIIILPPLVFIVAYGLVKGTLLINNKNLRLLSVITYILIWTTSFIFYQHTYWVHYPWDSERWWGGGWQDAIHSIKEADNDSNKVYISMEEENSLIYFAGWYGFEPIKWQEIFSAGAIFEKNGTINALKVGKYYFPDRTGDTLEKVAENLTEGDLYLANASEMNGMDIETLENIHNALNLIKVIKFPSGEDAFYLFSHI